MKIKQTILIILFLLVTDLHLVWAITIKISDTRQNNYYLEALNLVLEKSEYQCNIISTGHPLSSQARKVALVKKGEIDIMYAGTSMALEKQMLPVRFPIMRGLIGRRVFIIHKDYQVEYDLVKNIDGLKNFMGIQGFGWGDKRVLEASGLRQEEELYDDIFSIINAGSHHYFPRGVTEAYSEIMVRKTKLPNLAVEDKLLLVYKTAVFFFIHPSNSELEHILTAGFLNAYKDGSYNRFFYSHPLIKHALEQADLENRTSLEIPNPFLSPETDAIPKQYWH